MVGAAATAAEMQHKLALIVHFADLTAADITRAVEMKPEYFHISIRKIFSHVAALYMVSFEK